MEKNTVCGDDEEQDHKESEQEKGISFRFLVASEKGKLGWYIFHVGWVVRVIFFVEG
jgi:hypothetical protein